jgi:uncharacterized membrane protein YgdD (TMEM256/DUF423 family)
MQSDPLKLRIAGGLGFLAVALGAFGAHALQAQLEAAKMTDAWKTATHYHLAHSIVLLVLAFVMPRPQEGRWAFRCFTGGIVLFSGSLYALALSGIKWLVAITPLGGFLLLAGWLMLMLGRSKE